MFFSWLMNVDLQYIGICILVGVLDSKGKCFIIIFMENKIFNNIDYKLEIFIIIVSINLVYVNVMLFKF